MVAFKDLSTAQEIKAYLLKVLSRTGNRNKDTACLYHYTKISSLLSILSSGFFWLGSAEKMNDYLEGEFIQSVKSGNRLFFSCFSRAEENLAMYKMYAPGPSGAMMAVPFSTAQAIVDLLPKSANGSKLVRIVRDNKLTNETVEADVYWSAVVYKDLHTNLLVSETVVNNQMKNALTDPTLAGFVKLYGWEYEKEVRLCAVTARELQENERVAIPLTDEMIKKVSIVTVPGFDKKRHRGDLSKLRRMGVSVHDSEYDGLVDLGFQDADRLELLEKENEALKKEIDRLKAIINKKV